MSTSNPPAPAPDASPSLSIVALVLALFCVVLYARSLGFDFVDFDDRMVLLAHPQLYDEHSLLASLRAIFVDYFPREEPLLLRDLSWALDARVFGFRNPVGYHLGNIALNAANAVLLFLFLQRATRRLWPSAAIAAAFAALPVHVEAVSWVMGRKDVLSTALVLGALLAQAHALDAPRGARRNALYAATLACTALALLAKIAAFPCVALLGLHRVFQPYLAGRRAPGDRLEWRALLRGAVLPLVPHALVTASIVLWYQRVLSQFGVIGSRGPGTFSAEHLANVATFFPLVVGCYLRSLLWPADLSAYYRWPDVELALSTGEKLASAGVALGIAAFAIYCCVRRRDLAFYALAFLALLVPYSGIVFVDIWRADRYVYLASFAALALVAFPLADLGRRRPALAPVGVGVAIAYVAVGALLTLRQEAVWTDNESLWLHEAYLPDPSLLAIRALAAEYGDRAEHEKDAEQRRAWSTRARQEASRGIEREAALGRRATGYATSEQLQLARLYALLGKLDRIDGAPLATQIAHYEQSLAIAPHRANEFLIAGLYLEYADSQPEADRERIVRLSFERFRQYLAESAHDPAWRDRNAALLTNVYERRYPYLASAIGEARETYFR
jgi:hypothetical protein